MPTVAIVAGMAILFFYDDHEPPHFHVRAANFKAKMALADLSVIEVVGRMRPSDVRTIRDWAQRHRVELFENWARPQTGTGKENRGLIMLHRITAATARRDHSVEITWEDGTASIVSFAELVARGGVCEPMRDLDYFVKGLSVGGNGDWLAWGDVDFSADSLWYKAHPDDAKRDLAAAE